jgi:ferrous iron transport protein B
VALCARLLPDGFWQNLLVGPYGLLTLGLFNAVFTVLPILSIFFLVFGAMEDIGYLPNLTILLRHMLSRIGITGNSIIPLVLGFGCKTMATMTARSLPSRKEKIIVIFLIAFAIPCSAQMGLNMAILGRYGPQHFLVTVAILALVEIGAGFVLNKILPAEPPSQFIQELPPIRAPRVSALLNKTGHRLLWFLKEAIPIFLIASVVLFLLDASGALSAFKRFISPVITGWLGLPIDMADALMLTMARHEAAAGMILKMSKGGLLDGVQSIVAVSITTMFVPCIANIIAMMKELGIRTGLVVALSINVSSFALAGGIFRLLRLLQGGLGL